MEYASGEGGHWAGGEDSPALFTCFTAWSSPLSTRIDGYLGRWAFWSTNCHPFHKFEWYITNTSNLGGIDITGRDLVTRWRNLLFCFGAIG